MGKPIVFNYSDYEKLKAAYDEQVERNKELMEEIRRLRSKASDLSIRCRIAEADLEQVTGKLKNIENTCVSEDCELAKEKKSKLDQDLISRQDALQVAFKSPFFSDALIEEIKSLPSEDRPIGKWLKRHTIGDVDFAYCSNCGEPIIHGRTSPLWNYCPNCGAKMEV